MNNISTICLSMIVKNESHVVIKTLNQLISVFNITYIIICDTGSTDNTIELIDNFIKTNSKNIPGEIHSHLWKDFSHNRNLALDLSRQKAEYSLIFDADDIVQGTIKLPDKLIYDMYFFKMDKTLTYNRPLLINNNKKIKWYGVLHECLKNDENVSICYFTGDYYIESGHIGDRNKNRMKFFDDGQTLEKEIKRIEEVGLDNIPASEHFLYSRYLYYCAQSYRDLSNSFDSLYKSKAIEYYKKVVHEPSGWFEEKYVSCYELGIILTNEYEKLYYLFESFKHNENGRIECACEIIKHCINTKNYKLAKNIYDNFKNYKNTNFSNNLFVRQIYYIGVFEYYYSLCADSISDYEEGIKCCEYCIDKSINVDTSIKNLQIYRQKFLLHNKIEPKKYLDYILIFTLSGLSFNYSTSKTTPLGGSEKAMCYLAYELAKSGKNVIFSSDNIIPEKIKVENSDGTINTIDFINLIELRKIINTYKLSTIILVRDLMFFNLYKNYEANKVILWQHDLIYTPHIEYSSEVIKNNINNINNFVCLTEWHKQNNYKYYEFFLEEKYNSKIKIINNGIDIQEINSFKKHDNIKQKNSFIFSSRPERGLYRLLELWPSIIENLEDACLYIAYGWGDFNKDIIDIINKLNQDKVTIILMHKLSISELYSLMHKCEYWMYPCCFDETSCITSLEIMTCGIIPLYYKRAGLYNTMNNGKCGIIIEEGNEIEKLIEIHDTIDIKTKIINECQEYTKNMSWKNTCSKFLDLINSSINYKTYIINLKHRTDRKEKIINTFKNTNFNFEFYDAIYGKDLIESDEIFKLFQNNNFDYKKGVIGCALSHFNIWKELVNSNNDFYVVFEDDISICDNFEKRFNDIIQEFLLNNYEFLNLGKYINYDYFETENSIIKVPQKYLIENNHTNGTFGYIISKNMANIFINYINNNSIFVAIDHLIVYMNIYKNLNFLKEDLVFAQPFHINNNTDTDIQTDIEKFNF